MKYIRIATCITLILAAGLSACTPRASDVPSLSQSAIPQAEVLFMVEVPDSQSSPGGVTINILDEVTGLALNPTIFTMKKRDNTHFSITLPVNVGTVLKYRYARSGSYPIPEVSADGESLRYRLAVVDTPMTIFDTVPAWEDRPFIGETGRIKGSVVNLSNNAPIPNIVVTAGGLIGTTASDGSFIINGLPPGTHNLVAYSLDGSYLPFQQGAAVESGLTTPAVVGLMPGVMVNLTFLLRAPTEYDGLPVRLAGSITQLGNTFSDLSGGSATLASHMPIMAGLEDGRRYVTITVAAGTYIEYKYTLGDGFWNAELDDRGSFKLRGLVVPAQDTIIQDEVITWSDTIAQPIRFELTVPSDTPPTDIVSIQFNPFGWMAPIPMWQDGEYHWSFILYNPLKLVGRFTYRYCRNGLCGKADDEITAGIDSPGRSLSPDIPLVQDIVNQWEPMPSAAYQEPSDGVVPYGSSYLTGIELSSQYEPAWQTQMPAAIIDVHSTDANSIVLAPTWSCSKPQYPECQYLPGKDPSWQEIYEQIWLAKQQGLDVILNPSLQFNAAQSDWWQSSPQTIQWWLDWYENYARFMLHFSDLAQQAGVSKLIIGGEWRSPTLPGGTLPGSDLPIAPGDSIVHWVDLLSAIRAHYTGEIVWQINNPDGLAGLPPFIDSVDSFYVTFNEGISTNPLPTLVDLQDGFAGLIDLNVYPLVEHYGKPVYVGIAYPSSSGSASGCWLEQACGGLDLTAQYDIYRAALTVVNYRDWLSGFISQGYYPPASLSGNSTSIHGKPTQTLLRYWYSYIIMNP